MKRVLGLLSVIVMLATCQRPAVVEPVCTSALPSDLAAIDTLMQTRPDSALTLLIDTVRDDPYYHLLLSEALYKNDYAQTNRAELLEAMTYFDSIHCPFLSARAHYMNGVGYYETDSVVAACGEYMKALEIMEENYTEQHFTGHKAKFMALTYTHLCELFSDQYLHEQAIYFGKASLAYFKRYDAPVRYMAWTLDEIGLHYNMMEQWDSAEYYYDKAIEFLPDTNNLTYRDVATARAFLSYHKNNNPQTALKQLHSLLAKAENESEYLSRCLIIGEVYYHEEVWDSAQLYLHNVFNLTDRTDPKILSAQYLNNICLKTRDSLSSSAYTLYLSQQANTSDIRASLHSELMELYLFFEQNKKDTYYKKQNSLLFLKAETIFFISFFAIVSLSIIFTINLYRRKQMKKHNEEVEQQLEFERQTHAIQKAALSGKLKKSNQSLRETTKQLKNYTQNTAIHTEETTSDFNAFKACDICKVILEVVETMNFKPKIDYLIYKNCALDKKQLKALLEAADLHLQRFTIRLRKKFPALTEEDTKYCCLYLLGLNEADISALMQRAYSTVCERNRKIKKIMKADGELFVALRDMV